MKLDKKYLNPLLDLLKIPSISTQDEYKKSMAEARQYLISLFKSLGFKTQILKGIKHDLVFAEHTVHRSLPTVLVYGHYDVQPPDPMDEWKTDPFKPIIKGEVLYARGATDDKGQVMLHIMTVKKLLDKNNGKAPINFKFIIEGEEEIGSMSVQEIAKKYTKLLKCDYLMVSDGGMIAKGKPSIEMSLRGLLYTEINLVGGKHDMHSGQFGGVADNPANVLARIITELKGEDGYVNIPGFYDDVVLPTKKELKDYNAVKATKEKLMKDGAFFAIGGGEANFSLNERKWSRPTLDVNGIWGGYQGEGSKTIIPAKAGAKVSMRLVPNQDPDKIYRASVKYVTKLTPKDLKLSITRHADGLPYKAPTDHPVFDLVKKSLKQTFKNDAPFVGVGGTIGFVPVVVKKLNVPCLLIGFGLPDDDLHAPNEHFSLDNYEKGIEAMSDFYSSLPELK